jgi:putative aldouronate transport system substrate-binding protein
MFKRVLSIVLIIVLMAVLASCAPGNTTAATTAKATTASAAATTAATTTAAAKLKLNAGFKLTIITTPASAAFPEGVSIMNSEFFTKAQAISGYTLNWQLFKAGESTDTQANLLMASGNAPDLIQGVSNGQIAKYAQDGGLTVLDDALDQYGIFLKSYYTKDVLDYCRINGKLYVLPRYKRNNGYGLTTLAVRTDWLTQLNLKAPTTIDELYTVLKAVKAAKPTVIPLVVDGGLSRMAAILGGFDIYSDRSANFLIENKKATFPYIEERGASFIKFMNKLYVEGLIAKEFLIDKEAIQKMLSGNGFIMDINYVEIVRQMSAFKEKNPTGALEYIAPPKSASGKNGTLGGSFISPLFIVPKTSSAKVADCVDFLNKCNASQEMLDLLAYGVLDRDYKKNADGSVTKLDNFAKISGTKGYYSRVDLTDSFDNGNNKLEGFEKSLAFLEPFKRVNEILFAPMSVPADAGLIANIQKVVVDDMLNMIITGYSDTAFAAMKKKFTDAGGDKILAQYQAWYDTKK